MYSFLKYEELQEEEEMGVVRHYIYYGGKCCRFPGKARSFF
jgi:hypothetical protein